MTTGTNFVRGANPVWYFVDLNGHQFDDSCYLWVLTNTVPYIPAPVYHDINGMIPWTDPIQFNANGTLPIDIFFQEGTFYRLEVRKNDGLSPPSQADALEYLVENYLPTGNVTEALGAGIITNNLITNPQFALKNFGDSYTLTAVTNPAAIDIAPGWYFDGSGAGMGSVTIEQVALNTTLGNPTNAPFVLKISTSGWTNQPILRQRFADNGMNWQNKTVAASVTARMDSSSQNLLMRLVASNGQPIVALINTALTTSFVEYQGNGLIPAFTNLDLPPNAYIDLKISLPTTGIIYLTSVQITESETDTNVEYQQETVNRQIDHTFNYYQPALNYKPTSSYLVGWDFPFNPSQINGDILVAQAVGANKGFYAWDQTILFQTANSGVSVSRAANGGLKLTCTADGQIAVIQYLDQVAARKILRDRASVHIDASTTKANGISGNVTLWATTDDPVSVLPDTLITTLGADGIPTALATVNWTQVPNLYQATAFTLSAASSTNSESADIYLNGWDMQNAAPTDTAKYFAIVVGFEAWTSALPDTITLNSISLCPGDIATRPAPKTLGETLLDCQRYFYSTFPLNTKPATNFGANTGAIQWLMVNPARGQFYSNNYPIPMRVNPTLILYNPVAANNQVRDTAGGGFDSTTAAASANSNNKVVNLDVDFMAAGTSGDILAVHLTADARIGVV